jgi:lysophospholipid acyltransferase (LPLAT)-like uncharacterized protein
MEVPTTIRIVAISLLPEQNKGTVHFVQAGPIVLARQTKQNLEIFA